MCGIVGYIGKQQALPLVLNGLERLEYRGYDSAGIAIFDEHHHIVVEKKVGKVSDLRKKIGEKEIKGTIGIGHTRWATHGGVTEANAHPHSDQLRTLALIHNGIIENYQTIKKRLQDEGHTFSSETDTEVLAHLIGTKYVELVDGMKAMGLQKRNDNSILHEAVRKALIQVKGAYSIVVFHKDHPDCLVAARLFSPLIIGIGKNETFVASDIPAILEHTREVLDLEDNSVALITKDSVHVTDLYGNKIISKKRHIDFSLEKAEKQGFHHFLIKEIHESPRVVRDVLLGKLSSPDYQIHKESLAISREKARQVNHIQLVACGTAHYATLIGKYLFQEWAGIQAEAITASEYRYSRTITYPTTIVLGVSQSGETADTLAGLRKVQDLPHLGIMALTNVVGSSITRMLPKNQSILLNAGPEISVASTKAFTSMVVVLALLALAIAEEKQSLSSEEIRTITEEILVLPEKIDTILKRERDIARTARYYVQCNSMYYIGRGINFPTALEGALKLKEISYIHAEGYAAGEMKHGPIAVLQKGFPVVCLATKSITYEKMISNIQEALAREADVIVIANDDDTTIANMATHVLYVPETIETLSPILNNIALQLFAYYTALYKGYSIDNPRSLEKSYPEPHEMIEPPKALDIDKPRNLAKSVTVE